MKHAKVAKPRRGYGAQTRVGKEDWLLETGERIAHVPQSRDALSRAKVAKPRRGYGAQTRVGKEDWLLETGERIAHVPQSRDALSRAKVAKVGKESRCENVGM